jgi:hypothetical protein
MGVSIQGRRLYRVFRPRWRGRGFCLIQLETANKLQDLEFEVVILWHLLSDLLEPDSFHLAPCRLCVPLMRPRQAGLVVGWEGDEVRAAGSQPADHSPGGY